MSAHDVEPLCGSCMLLAARLQKAELLLRVIGQRTVILKQSGLGGFGADIYDMVIAYAEERQVEVPR